MNTSVSANNTKLKLWLNKCNNPNNASLCICLVPTLIGSLISVPLLNAAKIQWFSELNYCRLVNAHSMQNKILQQTMRPAKAQQGRTFSSLECVTCPPRRLHTSLSSKRRTSVVLPWHYTNIPNLFFFFFFATWAHTPLRLLESILKPVAAIVGYFTDKKIETVTNKKFSLIVLYLFQKLRDSVKNV